MSDHDSQSGKESSEGEENIGGDLVMVNHDLQTTTWRSDESDDIHGKNLTYSQAELEKSAVYKDVLLEAVKLGIPDFKKEIERKTYAELDPMWLQFARALGSQESWTKIGEGDTKGGYETLKQELDEWEVPEKSDIPDMPEESNDPYQGHRPESVDMRIRYWLLTLRSTAEAKVREDSKDPAAEQRNKIAAKEEYEKLWTKVSTKLALGD